MSNKPTENEVRRAIESARQDNLNCWSSVRTLIHWAENTVSPSGPRIETIDTYSGQYLVRWNDGKYHMYERATWEAMYPLLEELVSDFAKKQMQQCFKLGEQIAT